MLCVLVRKHHLQAKGYGFSAVVQRVANLLDLKVDEILRWGKQAQRVKARSLICFWAKVHSRPVRQKQNGPTLRHPFEEPGIHESPHF